MFGVTVGELMVVAFVVVAVVSAPWWPRLGAAIAVRLAGGGGPGGTDRETPREPPERSSGQ